MDNQMRRRRFLGIVLVALCAAIPLLAGCGGSSRNGGTSSVSQAPIPVSYSATVFDALVLHAAQEKTIIATRNTPFGKEVIEVGGRKAIKGTAQDDGFVILVDGQNPGVAVDQAYLSTFLAHPFGLHTIEVRHVPFGERGENVKPFLTFPIDVR